MSTETNGTDIRTNLGTPITRRALVGGVAALAASGLLAGCSGSESSSGSSSDGSSTLDTLRIGYFQSPNGELLAKGDGSAQEAFGDTELEYVLVEAGSDVLTAIASESIDIATIGTPPGVLGLTNDLEYKIFYLEDLIGASEALVVKEDSGIESVADLAGHSVATASGSTSHLSLLGALELAGLSETDIDFYDMSGPETIAAWQRGDIDAAYMWQPTQQTLLDDGGKVIITSEELAEQGYATGEFNIVRTAFYEEHPEAIETYIEVLDAATTRYLEGSDETVAILVEELGLTEEQVRTVMPQINVLNKDDQPAYFGTQGNDIGLMDILTQTNDYLVTLGSAESEKDEEFFADALLSELYE